MKQRIGMGSLLSCCLATVLTLFPTSPWDLVFLALLTLVISVSMREYCHLVDAKGEQSDSLWAYFTAIGYPLVHYAVVQGFFSPEADTLFWWSAFFSLLCLSLFHPKQSFTRVALTFLGFCYIVLPLGEIITIAYNPIQSDDVRLWLLYGIGITKITDIAALFVGRYWGSHLLAPNLSPKKTWEGALSGMLAGCLWSLIFAFFSQNGLLSISLSYAEALLLGTILPIFGQVGDMVESLFKRQAGVKDSGSLPGLGGMLDLVDSLLFTIPVLALFLRVRGMQ